MAPERMLLPILPVMVLSSLAAGSVDVCLSGQGQALDVRAERVADHVGELVAGAVERLSGQGQTFDIVRQREGDGADDAVGSFAGVFGDGVAGIVDTVAVIAVPARHLVRAEAAIQ